MSDTPADKPAPKFCPHLSTVQVVPNDVAVQGTSTAQPQINLQGIQGIGNAATAQTSMIAMRGGFGYKTKLTPEMTEKLNKGQMKIEDVAPELLVPVPSSLSAPCAGPACVEYCEEHGACQVGGCQDCNVRSMTKAFADAMQQAARL